MIIKTPVKFTGVFNFSTVPIEQLYKHYLSCNAVTTDTRNIAPGNMFFALKGEKFNANTFAEEAVLKGAKFVVVDELTNETWREKYGQHLIIVDDVLRTMQQLAGYHRSKLSCPVLAITGSNGKTTTKELTAAVLAKKFKTYATKGNLNNHIGIPLTLLAIKPDMEFAVIEMGANHQGEIAGYCQYVKPDYGLITNVGLAHTEGFGGFEGVVKGKTELYAFLIAHGDKIFVSSENDILLNKIKELGYADNSELITYGKSNGAFCSGSVAATSDFLSIEVAGTTIQTNLVGEYNFENVMSAACIGKYFGIALNDVKDAIENYVPTNNRSQKIQMGSNTIILDAYNANPSSMSGALRNFEKINAAQKITILGEMMELGSLSETEHQRIADTVKAMPLAQRIFVGSGFSFLKNDKGVLYFESSEQLKTWFKQQHFENAYLLIKGSRKNELEKILKD